MSDIFFLPGPISRQELVEIANKRYGDIVKGVVDIVTHEVALGGELHADQEALFIEHGNEQENLWGFNIYVEEDFPANIEFDSMINIRPRQNNRSRYVESEEIRDKIYKILKGYLLD
jgi:hypothetical protein